MPDKVTPLAISSISISEAFTSQGVHRYRIIVIATDASSSLCWSCTRRYSQFVTLCKRLALPLSVRLRAHRTFPSKHVVRQLTCLPLTSEQLDRRRAGLEARERARTRDSGGRGRFLTAPSARRRF